MNQSEQMARRRSRLTHPVTAENLISRSGSGGYECGMHPRLLFLTSALIIAAGGLLPAQTSPWPFPPRAEPAPAGPPHGLSVAYWNIQWFPGTRPSASKSEEERQVRAVHGDIVKLSADVIGMEEVRDWNSAALAVRPLPGFKVDVVSNFPPREGQTESQQVAIASRLQPISAWAEMWRGDGPITPPRGFAFAAYQLAPGKLLLVYGLHLKSNRGELVEDVAIREESMRQLVAHMKDMEAAYAGLGYYHLDRGRRLQHRPRRHALPRGKDHKSIDGKSTSAGSGKASRSRDASHFRRTSVFRPRASTTSTIAGPPFAKRKPCRPPRNPAITARSAPTSPCPRRKRPCLVGITPSRPRDLRAPARASQTPPRCCSPVKSARNICTGTHCAPATKPAVDVAHRAG